MRFESEHCVYIMTNKHHTVLYTGVTADLAARIAQHKGNPSSGFSGRYRTTKLVYIELVKDADQALFREKQIKAGSRQKKIDLINA
jgi:putative endonuclease